MVRILKVQIPAKVVFRLDEFDLDDLGVMGRERWLRRSRDGAMYESYGFVEGDVRAQEVLAHLQDTCGPALRVLDVTTRYTFVTTTAPRALDFDSSIQVDDLGERRLVAVLKRLRHRQVCMYDHMRQVRKEP